MAGDLGKTLGDEYVRQLPDTNPIETTEWIESLDAVAEEFGPVRARYLVAKLLERAHEKRLGVPGAVKTPYINTIPLDEQPEFPGDEYLGGDERPGGLGELVDRDRPVRCVHVGVHDVGLPELGGEPARRLSCLEIGRASCRERV